MDSASDTKSYRNRVPFRTIDAASRGEIDAIFEVIKHYEKYILALSVMRFCTDDGASFSYIDETLRRELELRLVTKVIGFKFRPAV